MLTLSLLRHAKSDWSVPGQDDFDRALNDRGRKAAPRMGAYMAAQGLRPQLVLCSTAIRARQTLDLVLPELGGKPQVRFDAELYLAPAGRLLSRIRALAGAATHVLVVAHDPGLHELAVGLAKQGDAEARRALARKFPTAALAVLTFAAKSWPDVEEDGGVLKVFMTPRRLEAGPPDEAD